MMVGVDGRAVCKRAFKAKGKEATQNHKNLTVVKLLKA